MRIFIICLFVALGLASASHAKDDKGGSAQAPSFRDQLKDYKYEIPGKDKKLNIPETYESPSTGDLDDGSKKFGKWWVSSSEDRCQLEQVAEGQQRFFLAFESHVHFTVDKKSTEILSIYVPSKPHARGAPIALVDSRSYALSPQTAKTFVPNTPQAQKQMLQAMNAGKILVVKWVDGDGDHREDRYPLAGFSEAYSELGRRCP